jgi:hypothetical protein
MKKIVIMIAMLAIACYSQAQTEEGNFVIGGQVEFNYTKNDVSRSKSTNMYLLPTAGYFISDNLAIGAGIGFQTGRYKENTSYNPTNDNPWIKYHGITLNPFVRKYLDISEQLKFFGQFSGMYSRAKSKYDYSNKDDVHNYTDHIYGGHISPGIVFFPSPKFGIEFALEGITYYHNRRENAEPPRTYKIKTFSIGADLFAPRVGLQYYIN